MKSNSKSNSKSSEEEKNQSKKRSEKIEEEIKNKKRQNGEEEKELEIENENENKNENENINLIENENEIENENINEDESIYKEIKPKPAKVQIFSNFEISQLNQDLFITAISFDQWKYLESEFSHSSTFYKKEEPKKPEIQKSTFPEEFCLSIFTFLNENNREYQNKEIVENNYKKGKVNFNCVDAKNKNNLEIKINWEKLEIFDLDSQSKRSSLNFHEYQFLVNKHSPNQALALFLRYNKLQNLLLEFSNEKSSQLFIEVVHCYFKHYLERARKKNQNVQLFYKSFFYDPNINKDSIQKFKKFVQFNKKLVSICFAVKKDSQEVPSYFQIHKNIFKLFLDGILLAKENIKNVDLAITENSPKDILFSTRKGNFVLRFGSILLKDFVSEMFIQFQNELSQNPEIPQSLKAPIPKYDLNFSNITDIVN
ncbi:hypothetical protein M0811_07231 [Anaeramoeba ignava]|uniref:Uncharacterized protein n=1 Tax=Anaeramoeba ignava TaxID=1746090 RepID=A0A9Q0LN44_ANAIG|nr:hypothetical protein M0811_07231 [Anaeramoeba ignava]